MTNGIRNSALNMDTDSDSREMPVIWYMAQGYPVAGGHEAHILHYATEMRKHGFCVKVVVPNQLPRNQHRFLKELQRRQIEITSVADSKRCKILILYVMWFGPWLLWALLFRKSVDVSKFCAKIRGDIVCDELDRQISIEQPDIIHIFGRLAHNLWEVFPSERVIFHHATEGRRDESWSDEEVVRFKTFCNRAARNFAPGQGVAENVRREFGITKPIDTIFTMCPDEVPCDSDGSPLSVEDPECSRRVVPASPPAWSGAGWRRPRTEGPLRFGILCRFTSEKGIEELLEALKILQEKGTLVDFTFAGQGPLEKTIKAFIKVHQLERVRVVKVTSPGAILKDIDVFVHPSRTDAMPMALAEALMCSCPCLTTRVGGIPDLIRDGKEGGLINAPDAGEICSRIEQFMGMDESELNAFKQRARARYEEKCRPFAVSVELRRHYGDIVKMNAEKVYPRVLLLTPGPPDCIYSGGVLRKRARALQEGSLYWAHLADGTADDIPQAVRVRCFPLKTLHWRLKGKLPVILFNRWLGTRRRARKIQRWASQFRPDVIWVLSEGSAADVIYYLKKRMDIPIHLTFFDAPEVCLQQFCNCSASYIPIYLRRIGELVRMASSIDAVSDELVEHVMSIADGSDSTRRFTFPSSVAQEFVESLSALKCYEEGGVTRKIGLCGSLRIDQDQWSVFMATLSALPYAFELVVFADKAYFFCENLPSNVKLSLQGYAESEESLVEQFVKQGVHAAYLGLWKNHDKSLFAETSLSSKLTTYAAAGLPVIIDGPKRSVAWRLVDKYDAGVLFAGNPDDGCRCLIELFTDRSLWQSMSDGSKEMCLNEFNFDVNMHNLLAMIKISCGVEK